MSTHNKIITLPDIKIQILPLEEVEEGSLFIDPGTPALTKWLKTSKKHTGAPRTGCYATDGAFIYLSNEQLVIQPLQPYKKEPIQLYLLDPFTLFCTIDGEMQGVKIKNSPISKGCFVFTNGRQIEVSERELVYTFHMKRFNTTPTPS